MRSDRCEWNTIINAALSASRLREMDIIWHESGGQLLADEVLIESARRDYVERCIKLQSNYKNRTLPGN